MNTKNDVVVIHVHDVDRHKDFFKALQFDIELYGEDQFSARINDKIVVVVKLPDTEIGDSKQDRLQYYLTPRGQGIELWFSVPDIRNHYESAKAAGVKLLLDFGNRGYGKAGDYGTVSPEGYLFFFSQPDE
jgi:hypothetical protein